MEVELSDIPEIREILIHWINNMSDEDLLKMYTIASVSHDTEQTVATMNNILMESGLAP